MGFPPREIKQMTMWEYMACVQGWNKAQGSGGSGTPMSDEDYDALCKLGDMWNGDT